MTTYKQVDESCFALYDQVPQRLMVHSVYQLERPNRGLGGIHLVEAPVSTPWLKDFCVGEDESVSRWKDRWDLANWAFFMAFDGDKPVGAATIASRTEGVNMLEGRDGLAVLWDLRVHDDHKQQGIGQMLFDMAKGWSRAQDLAQLKIECQNTNVPAVNFYHKQGGTLGKIDEYAYYTQPEYRHETQLIWYLSL
ncbi:MAG: GNAT family N-acetyltransferase [Oscillospiraceae bacterium]|nr:GNAT family N-acetyltransferase [Oscillospiraceae bacterium]